MTTKTLDSPAVLEALSILAGTKHLPDVHWLQGDDLCDCTFQRIGEWTNPYLAKTLRVRLCCLWGALYKQYPQFVQNVDAFYDENRHDWVTEPREWDSIDCDMPLYLWHRQIAARTGRSLAAVRAEYRDRKHERPRKVAEQRTDQQPTEVEIQAAKLARLRLTGWL